MLGIVSVWFVAPEIGTLLRSHWYVTGRTLQAVTIMVAGAPYGT
jgi:hypothetical protein